MVRRFVARSVLGTIAAWLGSALIPGITTDGAITTFLLVGLFLAVGEVLLPFAHGGAAVLLFFLPRSARMFLLRVGEVAVTAGLVSGFGFSAPFLVGLLGLALLLSLLYALPVAR